MSTRDDAALARRRAQNRIAQRRYRWKKDQEKEQKKQRRTSTRQSTALNSDVLAKGTGGVPILPAPQLSCLPDLRDPAPEFAPQSVPETAQAAAASGDHALDSMLAPLQDYAWIAENQARPEPEIEIPGLPPAREPNPAVTKCRFAVFGVPSVLRELWTMGDSSRKEADADNATIASDETSVDLEQPRSAGAAPIPERPTPDALFPDPFTSKGEPRAPLVQNAATARRKLPKETAPAEKATSPVEPEAAAAHFQSALHIAAQKGHTRILRVLLQQQSMNIDDYDGDGRAPLYYAVMGSYEDMVTLLLAHGARLGNVSVGNENDEGGRPLVCNALHCAVMARHLGILRILLEHEDLQGYGHGMDLINDYDSEGMTPLLCAVDAGFEAAVPLLLDHGANVNQPGR